MIENRQNVPHLRQFPRKTALSDRSQAGNKTIPPPTGFHHQPLPRLLFAIALLVKKRYTSAGSTHIAVNFLY